MQLRVARACGSDQSGIRAARANPMEFNTIAISGGITMGSEGMKTSLVSPL
jgi:dihydroxy-acid dehydratase